MLDIIKEHSFILLVICFVMLVATVIYAYFLELSEKSKNETIKALKTRIKSMREKAFYMSEWTTREAICEEKGWNLGQFNMFVRGLIREGHVIQEGQGKKARYKIRKKKGS